MAQVPSMGGMCDDRAAWTGSEGAVRGRRGDVWEERSISSRSWHIHFHINGKLQLDLNYRGESCSAHEAGVAGNSIHGGVMRGHAVTAIA